MDPAPATHGLSSDLQPPLPQIEVTQQVTQYMNDRGRLDEDLYNAIRGIAQSNYDQAGEIDRIDSDKTIGEASYTARLAGIEVQHTCDAKRTEERLSRVESRASDAGIDWKVLKQQYRDLHENMWQINQGVEDRASDFNHALETLELKHRHLEEMNQSIREIEGTLANQNATYDRNNSEIRGLLQDMRRPGAREISPDEVQNNLSKLSISSGSPMLDATATRFERLERNQATSSASITRLRQYCQRLKARTTTVERLYRAENESSQAREMINSQLAECVIRMQGIDATLTSFHAKHEGQQARVVAVEETSLSFQDELDQVRRETDSQLGECIRVIQGIDNTMTNLIATRDVHSSQLEEAHTAIALLAHEHSLTWRGITETVNDAMEGNVATGISRALLHMDHQIQQLGSHVARSVSAMRPRSHRSANKGVAF
ncbi:MAG: hypothetical protein Q9225_006819 [Loekoesia sp. 1 TL-2023]